MSSKGIGIGLVIAGVILVIFLWFAYQSRMAIKREARGELQFNPRIDERWEYEMVSNIRTKRTVSGIPEDEAQKLGLVQEAKAVNKVHFLVKVEKVAPITLSFTYLDIDMEVYMDGYPMSHHFRETAESLKGVSFSATILPEQNGKVTFNYDYSKLSEEMMLFVKNLLPIDKFFDDFPLAPVKEGGSWKRKIEKDLAPVEGLKVYQLQTFDYFFNGFKNVNGYQCAGVRKTGRIVHKEDGLTHEALRRGEGAGFSEAIVYFDMQDGKLVSLQEKNSLTITTNVKTDAVDGTSIVDITEKVNVKID